MWIKYLLPWKMYLCNNTATAGAVSCKVTRSRADTRCFVRSRVSLSLVRSCAGTLRTPLQDILPFPVQSLFLIFIYCSTSI